MKIILTVVASCFAYSTLLIHVKLVLSMVLQALLFKDTHDYS